MKSLKYTLQESLRIRIDDSPYTAIPETLDELKQIIEDRYNELGPGTERNPVNFNDVDVSRLTSFSNYDIGIFENTKFKYIDISNWDVSSVENMCFMFFHCDKLKSLGDISNWDVSNVTDMSCMFSDCKRLTKLDISDWDVSNVKSMRSMFDSCYKLESVGNLSNWNVSSVENVTGMFYGCTSLKSVGDISKWNTANIEDMDEMFDDSGIINIPDWYKV